MRTKGPQLQVINTTVPNSYNVPIIATTIEEFYQYMKDMGEIQSTAVDQEDALIG